MSAEGRMTDDLLWIIAKIPMSCRSQWTAWLTELSEMDCIVGK